MPGGSPYHSGKSFIVGLKMMGHPSGQFAVVAPERWVSPALAALVGAPIEMSCESASG